MWSRDTMKATQISAFVANKPGELARLTGIMARFNINIKAISVSDGMDYGVARIIVNEIDRAVSALCEMGCAFVMNEVVMAEIPDRPGALTDLCRKLSEAGINIRYIYATVTPGGGVAQAVISTEDNDRAEEVIG
jgi:hypothetical protein